MGNPTIATNATRANHVTAAAVQAALAKEAGVRRSDVLAGDSPRKQSGYGLPCAKCHLYYPADLDACPTCKHNQRVSPVVPKVLPKRVETAPDPIPEPDVLENEREEFLKQFRAQLLEANNAANAQHAACKFSGQHVAEAADAEICVACYERLEERLEIFEGALQIDLKEAAQIVYDAVWADPSDPGKTYENAASALLGELRKRAGMNSTVTPFQPLSNEA